VDCLCAGPDKQRGGAAWSITVGSALYVSTDVCLSSIPD
jgi:hypothetical protein